MTSFQGHLPEDEVFEIQKITQMLGEPDAKLFTVIRDAVASMEEECSAWKAWATLLCFFAGSVHGGATSVIQDATPELREVFLRRIPPAVNLYLTAVLASYHEQFPDGPPPTRTN